MMIGVLLGPILKAILGWRCVDMPDDVLVEIFSWLPPESLFRFKCVSKSWYTLINLLLKNPEFLNKHLLNINNNKISCLVFSCISLAYRQYVEIPPQKLFKLVTVFHDDHDKNYAIEDFRLPTLPSEVNISDALMIHCNGIICLAHNSTVILYNPAIKEWRILPKPFLTFRHSVRLRVGLGYDSRGNDFKVVRFGHKRFRRDQIKYYKTRAEVYSMRRDSWREFGIDLEFDNYPYIDKEVLCKGVMYWLVWSHNIILSFNMSDEVFHTTPLQNNLLVTRKDHCIQLTVWNESVALFIFKQEVAVTNSIEIWVTDDRFGDVKGSCSWIKKLYIGPLVDIAAPLAFLTNDEILLETIDGGFILYNIHSQMLRNLTFIEDANSVQYWDYSYVKSLFSVQGGSPSCS